jgi:hypothetical protein
MCGSCSKPKLEIRGLAIGSSAVPLLFFLLREYLRSFAYLISRVSGTPLLNHRPIILEEESFLAVELIVDDLLMLKKLLPREV